MLLKTLQTKPHIELLLDAMKYLGCTVNRERYFSCENCNGNVGGSFDASMSQTVLCENSIRNQAHMNRVVIHKPIHAFDPCRVHVDWLSSVRHLTCSEAWAANLSGDYSVFRLHVGLKRHPQGIVLLSKEKLPSIGQLQRKRVAEPV